MLTARKLLAAKLRDVESSIRGLLRGFGLKVGAVSKGKFEARIGELVAGQAALERVVGPLLRARAALQVEYATSTANCWKRSARIRCGAGFDGDVAIDEDEARSGRDRRGADDEPRARPLW